MPSGSSRRSGSGPKPFAHHRTRGSTPGHFPEPGAVVHGLRTEEHVIRVASSVLVHRIGLQEAGAARAGVVHGCPEHPLGQAPATGAPVDEEADDGPHRSVVYRLHDGGPAELRVVLSRAERDPCDRDAVLVSDEPWHGSPIHQCLHRLSILPADAGGRSGLPVEHAETGSNDWPIEQLDQVGPPLLRDGDSFERHSGNLPAGPREDPEPHLLHDRASQREA